VLLRRVPAFRSGTKYSFTVIREDLIGNPLSKECLEISEVQNFHQSIIPSVIYILQYTTEVR
jgi:hypothetical protein